MIDAAFLGVASALWLGTLTSISPCPMATNIAAVSFIGKQFTSAPRVALSGIFYVLGRMLAYLGMGVALIAGILSAPDIRLGLATTVAVAAHEIPQEIGDFAILVYGGFSKTKALVYNLLSALAAVAGGFIYIALVDMVPELHGKSKGKKIVAQTVSVVAGLCIMWWLKILLER